MAEKKKSPFLPSVDLKIQELEASRGKPLTPAEKQKLQDEEELRKALE